MKRMMILIGCFTLYFVNFGVADTITKPHTFQDGDTIFSSEVNSNFDKLYDQVNKFGGAINIGSNGMIGIGTDNPQNAIHISNDAHIRFERTDVSGVNQFVIGATHSGDKGLQFYDATTDKTRLFISNSGNVGIGTESPGALLDLGNSSRSNSVGEHTLRIDSAWGVRVDTNSYLHIEHTVGGEFITPLLSFTRETGGGKVGIGTDSPATKLHVAGTITETSDARLKKNIKPIESSLEKIKKIQGVSFEWKKDSKDKSHENLGVIAQDVEKVFPELVYTENDKQGTKAVNYNGFVAPLIEAIKEQQNQIAEMKKEIARLKSDIAASNLKKKDDLMAYTDGLVFE